MLPISGRMTDNRKKSNMPGTAYRQELLAKFQDRRRAPLLHRRPRPGDVGSKGGNWTAVIGMVATLSEKGSS